jgi:SOS response regulatory protein OraA/RecX
MNEACAFRWTTVERPADELGPAIERPEAPIESRWNNTYGSGRADGRKPRERADREAIEAALRVDERKRRMLEDARVLKARSRRDWEDDGFDKAPARLTRRQLLQEITSVDMYDRDYEDET